MVENIIIGLENTLKTSILSFFTQLFENGTRYGKNTILTFYGAKLDNKIETSVAEWSAQKKVQTTVTGRRINFITNRNLAQLAIFFAPFTKRYNNLRTCRIKLSSF